MRQRETVPVKVRNVSASERDALFRMRYEATREDSGISELASTMNDVMQTDISWTLRIRLIDALRQMHADYPALVVRRTNVSDVQMPTATTYQSHVAPMIGMPTFRSDRMKLLASRAAEQGWQLTIIGSGHVKLERGGWSFVISRTSNGAGRAYKNARALAKRMGVDVEGI